MTTLDGFSLLSSWDPASLGREREGPALSLLWGGVCLSPRVDEEFETQGWQDWPRS